MNGEGTLLTRKLCFEGKSDMYINAVGAVTVRIFSESGALLGTSAPFEGDSTMAKLEFDTLDVSELNGKTFRAEFSVSGKLYSFGFADENGDFGGEHAAGIVR